LLFGFLCICITLDKRRGILLNHFVGFGEVERAVDGFYGFGYFGIPMIEA
jgi:hypothetical protein